MNCRRCGKKLSSSLKCSFCGYENVEGNVREMTRMEKNFYDGVTIEEDGNEEKSNEQKTEGKNFKYQRTYINLGSSEIGYGLFEKFLHALIGNSTLAKILAFVIFFAVAAILFFIAVPLLAVLLGVAVGCYVYAKFIRKIL